MQEIKKKVFEQRKSAEWQSQTYAKIVSGEGTDVVHRYGDVVAVCKSILNLVNLEYYRSRVSLS